MNILYLCDEYPPGQHGGIGTAVQLLARQVVKVGHKAVVAGLYGLGYGGEDEFEDEGVKVYRFRRGLDSKWFKDQRSLKARVSKRLLTGMGITERDIKESLVIYNEKLKKIILDHQIDIVEMPDYNDYIRFCTSCVPFPQLLVPTVVKLHGSLTYFAREANKQVAARILKMEQAILNQATAVSSVSKYTAVKSAAYLSYKDRIEILYNGINTDIPNKNIDRNPKQVIFTGSLVQKKGIFQLAQAWNIVNKQMPEARLLILGKGPEQKVAAYLNQGAVSTVTFMGHVKKEVLYDQLSASSISVFPSYAEAFALAPLEAMACGTAVINSNRTSGPELIDDGINGLLVDPDDVEQIASAILYLLNDADACARLSKNGNEKVREHFDINKIATQNIAFYNKVLEGLVQA
jgi:glycosyltransferase involved in cell wall biosynthesis